MTVGATSLKRAFENKLSLCLSSIPHSNPILIMNCKKAQVLEKLFLLLLYLDDMDSIMCYYSVFSIKSNLVLILLSYWVFEVVLNVSSELKGHY